MESIGKTYESHEMPTLSFDVHCLRHSENQDIKNNASDFESSLTEKGEKKAEILTTFKPPYTTGDAYVSELPRTKQTVENMRKGEWSYAKEKLGTESAEIIETARLRSRGFYDDDNFRKEYFSLVQEKGHSFAAQWFLDHKDQKPEGAPLSPEEMAAGYASVINDLISELKEETINKTKRVPKTVVSHDLNMEAFLFFTIGEQIMANGNLPGNTFMEKIGQVSELDGFQVVLDRKGDTVSGRINYKGTNYTLELDKLRELAAKYPFSSNEVKQNEIIVERARR